MSQKHGKQCTEKEPAVDDIIGYEVISRISHGIAGEHQNAQHISYHQHRRCDDKSLILMFFPQTHYYGK
jgi:hypothetical protein